MADPIALPSFARIVDDLLVSFTDRDDWPADHRCAKGDAPVACSHTDFAGQPLLGRLRDLIMPGTAPAKEDPGKRAGGKRHSPAPWDRKAGELVDEILRGSIDLDARVRRVLGMGALEVTYWLPRPGWHPPLSRPYRAASAPAHRVPLEDAGPAALRDLVRILPLLQDRHPDHHLAAYHPVGGAPSWEQPPEPAVRSWHQQALLITGHERPWPRVTQVPNPDHPDNCRRGEFLLGPACHACQHPSCQLLRGARMNRWVQARCPHCHSASLRQNPVTQAVECLRPRCRDEHGQRHVWSITELRALGLAVEERMSA